MLQEVERAFQRQRTGRTNDTEEMTAMTTTMTIMAMMVTSNTHSSGVCSRHHAKPLHIRTLFVLRTILEETEVQKLTFLLRVTKLGRSQVAFKARQSALELAFGVATQTTLSQRQQRQNTLPRSPRNNTHLRKLMTSPLNQ